MGVRAPGPPGRPPTDVVLAAEALRRGYGGPPVVDVDRLEVRSGEVLAILGPNGAGKSTLLRILMLLDAPDDGRIVFRGKPTGTRDEAARRDMAGLFQDPHLFAGTVAENVAFGLKARGVGGAERRRRVDEALGWLRIRHLAGARVHTLSGGEAQRVALARALVLQPAVLFLDEPTASLDVTIRRRFRDDLDRLVRTRAGAAVLVTHDPTDAFALADRIAVMEGGRTVQVATPSELVLEAATPFVATFTGAELLVDGIVVERDESVVRVRTPGGAVLAATTPSGPEELAVGMRAHVAYRPEDVVLAPADQEIATSARNRFRLTVSAAAPSAGLVRVRLSGALELTALLTRRSAEELAVEPGHQVAAYLKTTALRAFPAG